MMAWLVASAVCVGRPRDEGCGDRCGVEGLGRFVGGGGSVNCA